MTLPISIVPLPAPAPTPPEPPLPDNGPFYVVTRGRCYIYDYADETTKERLIAGGIPLKVTGWHIAEIPKPILGPRFYKLVEDGWVRVEDVLAPPKRVLLDVSYLGVIDRLLTFSDGAIVVPSEVTHVGIPAEGDFLRSLNDWEYNREFRKNKDTPQVISVKDEVFDNMRSDWQQLQFDLLAHFAYGTMTNAMLKTAWGEVTAERKAYYDQHGTRHGREDYILGINAGASKPLAMKRLLTANNLLKRIPYWGFYYKYECLDVTQPAPTLEWLLERPWLYHWTNQINSITGVVSRWPDLKKYSNNSVPILVTGSPGGQLVLKKFCTPVTEGFDLYQNRP